MNETSTAAIIGIIVSMIGTLITALLTYSNTRRSMQIEDEKVKKDGVIAGSDIVTKAGNLSLALAENLQSQLKVCVDRKEEIELEYSQLSVLCSERNRKYLSAITRLKSILVEHDKQVLVNQSEDCKGYPIIQSLIKSVIKELETLIDK